MDQDISSAVDALALQRIQAQDYRDAALAAAIERELNAEKHAEAVAREAARDAKTEAYRTADLAMRQQHIDWMVAEAAKLATPSQERWMELYRMHLAIRLGPQIITSITPNAVILDMVNDATDMTVQSWPRVKVELDKLA